MKGFVTCSLQKSYTSRQCLDEPCTMLELLRRVFIPDDADWIKPLPNCADLILLVEATCAAPP